MRKQEKWLYLLLTKSWENWNSKFQFKFKNTYSICSVILHKLDNAHWLIEKKNLQKLKIFIKNSYVIAKMMRSIWKKIGLWIKYDGIFWCVQMSTIRFSDIHMCICVLWAGHLLFLFNFAWYAIAVDTLLLFIAFHTTHIQFAFLSSLYRLSPPVSPLIFFSRDHVVVVASTVVVCLAFLLPAILSPKHVSTFPFLAFLLPNVWARARTQMQTKFSGCECVCVCVRVR